MSGGGQTADWTRLREEYAAWYATPKRSRRHFGLPRTQAEFAEMKDVDTRTLRRWQEREDFQAEVALHRQRLEGALVDGSSLAAKVGGEAARPGQVVTPRNTEYAPPPLEADAVFEEGMSRHELLYRQAKDDVFMKASEGSSAAIDLMMKYWGKGLLAKEEAEEELFAGMTDEQLAAEVVALLGPDELARQLARSAAP